MKYYPINGWKNYKFIVSPREMKEILKGFHLVEVFNRVPVDYTETGFEQFLNGYEDFYNKLVSSYKFDFKKDTTLTNLLIGITNDLDKCTYGPPFQDRNDSLWYKTNDFCEPCVGINLFALYLGKSHKLHSTASYLQFPENIMGLKLEFPKRIYSNEEKRQKGCEELETYKNVYETLVERIKQISKNLTIAIDEKTYRTDIKVSVEVLDRIKNTYFIKENRCTIR